MPRISSSEAYRAEAEPSHNARFSSHSLDALASILASVVTLGYLHLERTKRPFLADHCSTAAIFTAYVVLTSIYGARSAASRWFYHHN